MTSMHDVLRSLIGKPVGIAQSEFGHTLDIGPELSGYVMTLAEVGTDVVKLTDPTRVTWIPISQIGQLISRHKR